MNNPFLEFGVSSLNTFDLSGFNVDKVLAANILSEEISIEFDDLNSFELKEARLNFFNIQGAVLNDFAERVIDIGENRKLIFGIRHKGGNPELPFIQIIQNFEINEGHLGLLINSLSNYLSIFKPQYIKFWSNRAIESCLIGAVCLVSTHEEILSKNGWECEKNISFENITDDSYYEWYKKGYAEFHSLQTNLKDKVTINSLTEMRRSIDDKLIKWVLFDNSRIGLIAAVKEKFLGNDAVYFNEFFIRTDFRGKGLAKVIQRKFVSLFIEKNCYIWGSIDHQNLASYKSALSIGRKPVRYECFLPL